MNYFSNPNYKHVLVVFLVVFAGVLAYLYKKGYKLVVDPINNIKKVKTPSKAYSKSTVNGTGSMVSFDVLDCGCN